MPVSDPVSVVTALGPQAASTSASINTSRTCSPAPTANANNPSCAACAIEAIEIVTRSGNTNDDDAAAGDGYLDTAVPFHGCLWTDTRDLPRGRPQAGDRHLNFHENRDNLLAASTSGTTSTPWRAAITATPATAPAPRRC